MGRQRIEHLARDMKIAWCRTGQPAVRMRGHVRLELSSPKAFWWRLVLSRRGTMVPHDEDIEEVIRGFKIPEDAKRESTIFGELVFDWNGLEERHERA